MIQEAEEIIENQVEEVKDFITIFNQAEEEYKNSPKLVLLHDLNKEPLLNVPETTLEEFVIKFIKDYNNKYCTYIVTPTGNNIYCDIRRRRSIGDIYRISLNYFPEVKLYDLAKLLFNLTESNNLLMRICPTINKRVYFSSSCSDTVNCYIKEGAQFTLMFYYTKNGKLVDEVGYRLDEFELTNRDWINEFNNG